MKFAPIAGAAADPGALAAEYRAGRAVGVVRVGDERLFFRVRRTVYYAPYQAITRCYRRVLMVPARMCCGRGSLNIENLVLESEQGELAQIQLPGERAGIELMKALREKMPHAAFGCPKKPAEDA